MPTLSASARKAATDPCDQLRVACKFVTDKWSSLIPALMAGEYNAVVASMSITDERKKVVRFTDRYQTNKVRFVAARAADSTPTVP